MNHEMVSCGGAQRDTQSSAEKNKKINLRDSVVNPAELSEKQKNNPICLNAV